MCGGGGGGGEEKLMTRFNVGLPRNAVNNQRKTENEQRQEEVNGAIRRQKRKKTNLTTLYGDNRTGC